MHAERLTTESLDQCEGLCKGRGSSGRFQQVSQLKPYLIIRNSVQVRRSVGGKSIFRETDNKRGWKIPNTLSKILYLLQTIKRLYWTVFNSLVLPSYGRLYSYRVGLPASIHLEIWKESWTEFLGHSYHSFLKNGRLSMPDTPPNSTWAQYELGEGTEAEFPWEDITGNVRKVGIVYRVPRKSIECVTFSGKGWKCVCVTLNILFR